VGGLDLGFLPGEEGRDTQGILDGASAGALDLVFLLGADEIETKYLGNAFVVYQGTHGDAGAHRADVILPGAAYTEKSGLYVNTEGRVQMAKRAAFPPGDAREDWAILRALSATLGKVLPYDSLRDLRAALYEEVPHLATLDELTPADVPEGAATGTMAATPFSNAIKDFYMTNPIARASKVMADCAALANDTDKGATGTHG
jgi:NADH-quinone oxidoreductase subunit G